MPFKQYLDEVSRKVHQAPFNTDSQRALSKKGYTFSILPVTKQIQVWDYVWKNGKSFWIVVQAFFYCERLLKKDDDLRLIWPTVKEWQNYVTGWGLCDSLSKIYSKILELDPDTVLPVLTKWNHSTDPWKRRQSIVSLLYYNSVRKSVLPFDEILSRVDSLIADEDYYVQKGIGWTLRELYRAYPEPTVKYLLRHAQAISATAFPTVRVVLKKKEQETLKQLRKRK